MTKAFFNKQHQLLRSLGEGDPSHWEYKPIIHVYAEPHRLGMQKLDDPRCSDTSEFWFDYMSEIKELERIPNRTYIHGDINDGHWDICQLEKGVWEEQISPLLFAGDLWPVILYCYNRTYLTIGVGVQTREMKNGDNDKTYGDELKRTSDSTDFWVFYPGDNTLKEYYLKLKSHKFDARFKL